MSLIQLNEVDLAFGTQVLLDRVSLTLVRGERVAILGRNGTGKSTLMKLIVGETAADSGQVIRASGLRFALMDQRPAPAAAMAVGEMILAKAQLLDAFNAPSHLPPDVRTDTLIDAFGLPADAQVESLSGGARRKVDLACALAVEPDLLLLDEPTNHLDIASIERLSEQLKRFAGALVFVTHDRAFLRGLATRILELDRGSLTSWPGDYDNYLRRRAERENAETKQTALFDKRLAAEEVWIRKGIEARRTRNEGRVRALYQLRRERAARREGAGSIKLEASAGKASGKLVIDAEDLNFAFGDRVMVKDLSLNIMRGDRIGIIGPNGSGKTTLIRLLLGQLKPDSGEVWLGTQLEVAYFDQARLSLDERMSALDNVAEGRTHIKLGDSNPHIMGYLGDFLFTPEQALAPISRLSGGERNRLLLAKLFSKPHNLLVMDEPTNDLDLETLELLEEKLQSYPGTFILVSHDREFMDNVVTSTLALEGAGRVVENVGGYSDWLRLQKAAGEKPQARSSKEKSRSEPVLAATKMSYKDKRELELLPARIEALETEQAALAQSMLEPGFYRQTHASVSAAQQRQAAIALELQAAYARWGALESQLA